MPQPRESTAGADNRSCSHHGGLPLRLRPFNQGVHYPVDSHFSAGGLTALLVLPLDKQPLPLPEGLASHLIDHLDVDDELQEALRRRRLPVVGAESDRNICLVPLDTAADDRARLGLRCVAQPWPVVKRDVESSGELAWQFLCRRLVFERNDRNRPYVRWQPASRKAVRDAGVQRNQDNTISSKSTHRKIQVGLEETSARADALLPAPHKLSLIHISEPTRLGMISYA